MAFVPIVPKISPEGRLGLQLGLSPLGVVVFVACFAAGAAATARFENPGPMAAGALVGLYLLFAIRQANQWEKAIVLRFGRFLHMRGPGLFTLVPVVDSVYRMVDQRVRVTDVSAEAALTRDTVPVNVDAILYWVVWDAEKAVLEVENFNEAITLGAQTALREAIGAHELADLIAHRDEMGRQLQKILDEKTNPWGITVQSVEVKQVNIPAALEDAMSRRAQAERERQARIILGTAEAEIADKFAAAAATYAGNPIALNLRAMNMLYETMKERGSMVIVPSTAVDSMGLGGMMGIAAMGSATKPN